MILIKIIFFVLAFFVLVVFFREGWSLFKKLHGKSVSNNGMEEETNIMGLIIFFVFIITATFNLLLMQTRFSWLLLKINPFLFGFIFYSFLSGIIFKTKGIWASITVTLYIIFFTFILDKFSVASNPFPQFEKQCILLGLALGIVANIIERRLYNKNRPVVSSTK